MFKTSDAEVADLSLPRHVPKPWGYELIWAHTDAYAGKVLHIDKGKALSYQYHRFKDETIYVLSGSLDFEVAWENTPRKTLVLSSGDSFHIPPGLRHRMRAREDCEVLEASTSQLDDVVRLEDDHGRVEARSA